MLYDFFLLTDQKIKPTIKETIDYLSITFSSKENILQFTCKLFDELKTISVRDNFELYIDIAGNLQKISDTKIESYNNIIKHFDDNNDSDYYEITLNISKKCEESTISVYFVEDFFNFLSHEKAKNIIITFSKCFNDKLYFEVFSNIKNFYSTGINFYQSKASIIEIDHTQTRLRQSQLEMFKENGGIQSLNINILPSDFYLIVESGNITIDNFFSKFAGILSLIFIANASEFKSEDKLSYKISGYKTVICEEEDQNKIMQASNLLYKIFSWAYEGGNSVDKLGLVRNVLSIHLDNDGSIRFDKESWEAIRSNYQVYLKDNIQNYLNIKNKIGEIIIQSTNKTYIIADEILDSLKNNIMAILTFILTVVLVNGFKDNGYQNIFSNSYLYIVVILSVLSLFWMMMTRTESLKRFEIASTTIKEILKINYKQIIMESEIIEITDPIISQNREYLKTQINRYTLWWVIILLIFVLSFSAANYVTNLNP